MKRTCSAALTVLVLLLVAMTLVPHADARPNRVKPPRTTTTVPATTTTAPPSGSSDLAAILAAAPNGSTVELEPKTYLVTSTIELNGRSNLDIHGNGALIQGTNSSDPNRAVLRFNNGGGISLSDLTIDGGSTTPGQFISALQWQHGVDIRGTQIVRLTNVVVRNVRGDCVYVGLGTGWSDSVSMLNSSCIGNGRMGFAVVAGSNVSVRGSYFDNIGLDVFDMEPNSSAGGATNVIMDGNTLTGGFGLLRKSLTAFKAGNIDNIQFTNNTHIGRPMMVTILSPTQNGDRHTNFLISGNTSNTAFAIESRPAIVSDYITGITITNNIQPLGPDNRTADLYYNCGVTISGNTPELIRITGPVC